MQNNSPGVPIRHELSKRRPALLNSRRNRLRGRSNHRLRRGRNYNGRGRRCWLAGAPKDLDLVHVDGLRVSAMARSSRGVRWARGERCWQGVVEGESPPKEAARCQRRPPGY